MTRSGFWNTLSSSTLCWLSCWCSSRYRLAPDCLSRLPEKSTILLFETPGAFRFWQIVPAFSCWSCFFWLKSLILFSCSCIFFYSSLLWKIIWSFIGRLGAISSSYLSGFDWLNSGERWITTSFGWSGSFSKALRRNLAASFAFCFSSLLSMWSYGFFNVACVFLPAFWFSYPYRAEAWLLCPSSNGRG